MQLIKDDSKKLNYRLKQSHHKFFPPILYLTGSYPPLLKGLHLKILQIAIKLPFKVPYFWIASIAYCEHVGVYLQHEFFKGDTFLL